MTCIHTKTIDEQNVIIYICNSLFQTPNELNPVTRRHLSTSHPVVLHSKFHRKKKQIISRHWNVVLSYYTPNSS